jgi:hypothetical protein
MPVVLLIILSVALTGGLVITVSNLGVVFIVALCKVGDKCNWQQNRVGVGKSSHGGVGVCALSVISVSVGDINVGFVFSISTVLSRFLSDGVYF